MTVGSRRAANTAGTALAGALVVWAAAGATATVPGVPRGVAALMAWPDAAAAVAALVVALVAAVARQWAVVFPLAVVALPLVAGATSGVWIFTGAGVWIAWAVTATAGLRACRPVSLGAWSPRAHAWVAGGAAALWLGGVAAAVAPFAVTGDAPHYLTIARSLVADGDLDLRNDYDERRYADFYPGSLEPRHTNISPWGEHYPFHGVGVSVLVAPAFAGFGVAGATATLVLVMAGGAALVWLAAWHLLRDASAAWFGWAVLVLSAPYGLHAAAIYPDGPAAAAVAAALWLAALLHRRGAVPMAALAAGSCGLAALPWLHARLALPAGVLGAAIVWAIWKGRADRWNRLAWFLMVPTISLVAWVAAALVMFDTWNPSAAILQRTAPGGWTEMSRGLLGLVADHEYGLIPAAPVMASAFCGLAGFLRTFPVIGVATAVTTAGVLVVSSFWVWWGGDAAPARFATVVLPALALWAARLWSVSGAGGRRVMSLALAISAAMTALYARVDGGARAYAYADGRGSVFEAFSPSVDLSLALPSLFRTGESTALALGLALLWLAAGGAAAALAVRLSDAPHEGWASGRAALVLLTSAAVAAELGWRVAGRAPWTPAASALALVRDAAAGGLVGTAPRTWGLRPVDDVVGPLRLATPESIPMAAPMLLYVPEVPAGVYTVHAGARTSGTRILRVELGRDAWPFAEWRPGDGPLGLTLHAAVHSVRILGDGTTAEVWLQPRQLARTPPAGEARRVSRYGPVTVYSMDDASHPQDDGLWTGGHRPLRLLLAADPGVAAIDVQIEAGPAAVALSVTSPASNQIALAAGERRHVQFAMPAAGWPVDLRLEVRGGFPAAALGNRSDSRTLGAWLAFSPAPR